MPLVALGAVVVLLALGALGGLWLWLAALLGLYCVIPARLLLETKRKGLAYPRPPARRRPIRPRQPPLRPQSAEPIEPPAPSPPPPSPPAKPREAVPAKYRRRRAFLAILGLGVLVAVGAIMAIFGLGRAASSGGIILVGIGGFLMLLSVTLPAFKLVDLVLRAIGRLMSRPAARRRPARRPRTRSARRS